MKMVENGWKWFVSHFVFLHRLFQLASSYLATWRIIPLKLPTWLLRLDGAKKPGVLWWHRWHPKTKGRWFACFFHWTIFVADKFELGGKSRLFHLKIPEKKSNISRRRILGIHGCKFAGIWGVSLPAATAACHEVSLWCADVTQILQTIQGSHDSMKNGSLSGWVWMWLSAVNIWE